MYLINVEKIYESKKPYDAFWKSFKKVVVLVKKKKKTFGTPC